jgi:GTP-binding protein Era
MLKEIGRQARKEIEALLGAKVFLELWVKVEKDWREDPRALRRLGYQ